MKQKSGVQTAEAEEAEQEVAEVHSVAAQWSFRSHCGPAVFTVSTQDASGQEKKQEAESYVKKAEGVKQFAPREQTEAASWSKLGFLNSKGDQTDLGCVSRAKREEVILVSQSQ